MSLLDVLNAPWAIVPSRLEQIHAIYLRHLSGQATDFAAIEARLGRPLANAREPIEVVEGVALIALEGPLARRMNMVTNVSGGTSTEIAAQDIQRAAADPAVRAIVLSVDSPGGTVDGMTQLADAIRAAGTKKRVVTWASGMMASAAYWTGAAAGPGNIFIADTTTQVGSIGVVATHVDLSGAEAKAGIKTTEITAGKYKRIAGQYEPLSEAGRETLQAHADYVYSLFVESVASDRGVSVGTVLEKMADGRVFTGQQAINAGLVDEISTLEALVARLQHSAAPGARIATKVAHIQPENQMAISTEQERRAREAFERMPTVREQYGTVDSFLASVNRMADTVRPVKHEQTEREKLDQAAQALAAREGISYLDAVRRLSR